MPYIREGDRRLLDNISLNNLTIMLSPGQLNYLITNLCHTYLRINGINYTNFNAVVGALECAKLELYRKEIVPYEDKKIAENGDVKL